MKRLTTAMSTEEFNRLRGAPMRAEPKEVKKPRKARVRTRHVAGSMNKLESRMMEYLQVQKNNGEIVDFSFETHKLRLADKTFYTPDFFVLHNDGSIEFREVKGFWEDDARIKIKVAAAQYWFYTFTGWKEKAKKRGGGWECEAF